MKYFAYQDDFGWFSTGNESGVVVTREYNADTPIITLVDDVYYESKHNEKLDCLFLCGHGNSGVLYIANGLGKNKSTNFSKLKGAFNANSRGIELHGCAMASSTDVGNTFESILDEIKKHPYLVILPIIAIINGVLKSHKGTPGAKEFDQGYQFLKALAVNSGVKVTAPIDMVFGPSAAYSFKDVRTMTVFPNGKAEFSDNK